MIISLRQRKSLKGRYSLLSNSFSAPKKPSFSRKRPKPAEKYASPNDAYAAGVDEADFYANFRFSLDQSNGSNNWMESLKYDLSIF